MQRSAGIAREGMGQPESAALCYGGIGGPCQQISHLENIAFELGGRGIEQRGDRPVRSDKVIRKQCLSVRPHIHPPKMRMGS